MTETPDKTTELITVWINGECLTCERGASVSSVLLTHGINQFSVHPADASAMRGPFCMMGSCQACRVWINGMLQLACQTASYPGMTITTTANDQASTDLAPTNV